MKKNVGTRTKKMESLAAADSRPSTAPEPWTVTRAPAAALVSRSRQILEEEVLTEVVVRVPRETAYGAADSLPQVVWMSMSKARVAFTSAVTVTWSSSMI